MVNNRICDRCKALIMEKGWVARWRKGKLEIVCSQSCLTRKVLKFIDGAPTLVPIKPQQSWELSI